MPEDHALCGKVQSDLQQSNLRLPETRRRPYIPPMKILRPSLHLVSLLIAAVAGYLGVFLVGVPAVGDNPGAVAGGIGPFFLTYLFLTGAAGFAWGRWQKRKSWKAALLTGAQSMLSAFVAISAASVVFALLLTISLGTNFFSENTLLFAAGTIWIVLLFALEALIFAVIPPLSLRIKKHFLALDLVRLALTLFALLLPAVTCFLWVGFPVAFEDPVALAVGYTVIGAIYLLTLAVAGIIWGRFRKKQIWESVAFTSGQFVMSGLAAVATAGALTASILKKMGHESFLSASGAALWILLLFLIEIIAFTALQAARDWLKR
jgi:hypothetical protein